MDFDRFIGEEAAYPLEHRILNTVLLMTIFMTAFFSVSDYLIGLMPSAVINVVSCFFSCAMYYLSLVRRGYKFALGVAIAAVFLVTPAVWFTNAGIYGGTSLLMVIFAAMISISVKSARWIFILVGCLAVEALVLLTVQYHYPLSVAGYGDDALLFIDKFVGMSIALMVITSLYVIILSYYRREHRRAAEYLLKLEKQENALEMARLDRLNLIGEMAAGIGHEVRNPLTTIRGFLQLFRNRPEYDQHREHFDIMIGEIDRANSIITEFLSLAKNKAVRLEPCNINDILERIVPLIQAGALEAGKKVLLAPKEVPRVEADEGEIRQLVLNLANNALDAIGPDGRVAIGTYRDKDQAVLFVSDTGRGIPQEILCRLGTPFVTSKDKGTGLGIPICYRIAARHNTRIEVDTGAGGTTFRVRLKAAKRQEEDRAAGEKMKRK